MDDDSMVTKSIVVLLLLLIVFIISSPIFVFVSYRIKADIINKEFGTEYTWKEMLFAGDVISEIKHGRKHRIEIRNNQ